MYIVGGVFEKPDVEVSTCLKTCTINKRFPHRKRVFDFKKLCLKEGSNVKIILANPLKKRKL